MAPSFAPNPLTILQRRDENAPHTQRPKKKLTDRLPSPPPLLGRMPSSSPSRQGSVPTRPISPIRPISAMPRLRRSATSPLPVLHTSDKPAVESQPTELLVLAHGLQGMVDDFKYLLESLYNTEAARDGSLLIHASKVNQHKTHDGIILGGLRLAEDIRCVIQENESLTRISLVGFSLGGLYVRYAIGHLYNKETGDVAGLRPNKVVIVASPNLGVRNFGVYRFIPEGMAILAKQMVLGESTQQVMLLDDEVLLERMTRDDDMPFMSGLESFETRILYANIRNDFMVNYGTAALDTRVRGLNAEEVVLERMNEAVDRDYDDRGCKIAFEFCINGDEEVCMERMGGMSEDRKTEEVMAWRLKRLGWRVVGVEFPVGLPITHNRIVAMSRNLIHTWMNASGRRAVHHLVDTVSQGFAQHNSLFEPQI